MLCCAVSLITARGGYIFFPEFCQLVQGMVREEPSMEEQFNKTVFKVGANTMVHCQSKIASDQLEIASA